MSRRSMRPERAQATVEFALVLPVLILLIFGGLIVYSWQLQIDSAQFGAEEGIQVAAEPGHIFGQNGLLCDAGIRAYKALNTQSYLDGTPLHGNGTCATAASPAPQPDYSAGQSCPAGPGSPPLQTYASMLSYLASIDSTLPAAQQSNVALICAVCIDLSQAGAPPCNNTVLPTDEIEVQVTVVGYKQLPLAIPVFGKKIPFYGQNSQTVQAFSA